MRKVRMKKEQKESNEQFERMMKEIYGESDGGTNGTQKKEKQHPEQEENKSFIRVADDYYEIITEPRRFGPRETIQHRKKPELRQDFGGHFIGEILKYTKFIIKPDNVNYKREHGEFYNLNRSIS